MDFWLGFFYNSDITKILFIIINCGVGDEVLVAILIIAIFPVGLPVPSRIGYCRISLSGPWWSGGLQNSRRTASLSASQYFNIIFRGVSVCADCFFPLGHHHCPCAWRVLPQLFRFDPFFLSLNIFLMDLSITFYLLEPTLSLSLILMMIRTLFILEGATESFFSPPYFLPHHFRLAFSSPYHLLPVSSLYYPYPPIWSFPSCLSPVLLNRRL